VVGSALQNKVRRRRVTLKASPDYNLFRDIYETVTGMSPPPKKKIVCEPSRKRRLLS